MKNYRPARKRIALSVGESLRIVRQLRGLSQDQLAKRTGIPRAKLSAIENDRLPLGAERARILGCALNCDPAASLNAAPRGGDPFALLPSSRDGGDPA